MENLIEYNDPTYILIGLKINWQVNWHLSLNSVLIFLFLVINFKAYGIIRKTRSKNFKIQ